MARMERELVPKTREDWGRTPTAIAGQKAMMDMFGPSPTSVNKAR